MHLAVTAVALGVEGVLFGDDAVDVEGLGAVDFAQHAKAVDGGGSARRRREARERGEIAVYEPSAAQGDLLRLRGRRRIREGAVAKLTHVAVAVVQAPGIWLQYAHGMRDALGVSGKPRELSHARGAGTEMVGRIRTGAAGPFPFRFRRQAVGCLFLARQPRAEAHGVVPRNIADRMD